MVRDTVDNDNMGESTYSSVGGLLVLVTLLVGGSLGLVWGLLLVVEALPLLTEHLTDFTWKEC